MTRVALPLIAVTTLHSSIFMVAVIAASGWAPWLVVALPAGAIASMVPLRSLQMTLDIVQAGIMAWVPIAYIGGILTSAQLAIAAFVVASAAVVFEIGDAATLPQLVASEELERANSLMSISSSVMELAGPGMAGTLIEVAGAPFSLFIDVTSYLLSAWLLRKLPRQPTVRDSTPWGTVVDGWRILWANPLLAVCVGTSAVFNFGIGALNALFTLRLVRTLHLSAELVGLMFALEGAGSLVGAMLASQIGRTVGSARAVVLATVLLPVGVGALGLGHGFFGAVSFACGAFTVSFASVVGGVHLSSFTQRTVPIEKLPRVLAVSRVISWGILPVGSVFGGAVALGAGIQHALFATAAAVMLAPVLALRSRLGAMRDLPDAA